MQSPRAGWVAVPECTRSWTENVLLVTLLGKSYSCIKLLGCTEDAIVQNQVSDKMSSLWESRSRYLTPYLESTDSFWLQEPFSSQTMNNNNPESVQNCFHDTRRKRNALKHLSECSACYSWLSGKVAGKILWNWALFDGWLVDSWHGPQQNCINRKAANQLRNKPYGSQLSCALSTRGSRSICHLRCPVTTISELLTGFWQSKEILLAPDINEGLTSWLLIMQRNTLWNFYSCLLGWFVRLVNVLKYMLPHVGNRATSFSFLIAFQSVTEDRAEPKAAGSQGRWSEHTGAKLKTPGQKTAALQLWGAIINTCDWQTDSRGLRFFP